MTHRNPTRTTAPRSVGTHGLTEVLGASVPVLIDVTAPWCAPCRAAEPEVRRLADEFAGRLDVVRIDGERDPELVARLGVRGFPTFLMYDKGREVARALGYAGPRRLRELVVAHVTG